MAQRRVGVSLCSLTIFFFFFNTTSMATVTSPRTRIIVELKFWKKMSAVRLREVSALERVQLQRYKCISAGAKFAVRFREVSGLESVRLERVDCSTGIFWSFLTAWCNIKGRRFRWAQAGKCWRVRGLRYMAGLSFFKRAGIETHARRWRGCWRLDVRRVASERAR